MNNEEVLNDIIDNPHKLGRLINKNKLTKIHSYWIKYLWYPVEYFTKNDNENLKDMLNFFNSLGKCYEIKNDRNKLERHYLTEEILLELLKNPKRSLQAHRGSYKDIDINEPVLTTTGFKKHGDLKVGDKVFSPTGKPIEIVGVSEIFYNNCYNIVFSDSHSIICGEGHLWEVGVLKWTSRKENGKEIRTRKRKYIITSTKELSGHIHKPDNRLSVKLNKAVEFSNKDLPINPYLLGVWLGDGHSEGGRLTGHREDYQIIQDIEKDGNVVSSMFYDKRNKNVATYRIKNLTTELHKLNLLKNKHIPELYHISSIDQRSLLLQGLMDTDGSCNKCGNAIFNTKYEKLAKDVLRLSYSLGLAPRFNKYTYFYKSLGRDYTYYNVAFRAYKKDKPFRLKRKLDKCLDGSRTFKDKYIISVDKTLTIPTNCIKVNSEDGLYLVGNELTVTHNTTALSPIGSIERLLFEPNIRICLVQKNFTKASLLLQTIRQAMLVPEVQELFKIAHGFYPKPVTKRDNILTFNFKKTYTPEGNINAYGVIQDMTGKHFDFIQADDFVTLDDKVSKAEREKTKLRLEDIMNNILDPGKQIGLSGTPWHREDAWIICPSTLKFDINMLDILTEKEKEEKKRELTSVSYAANHELRHIASDSQMFQEANFARWDIFIKTGVYGHLDAKYSGDHTNGLTFFAKKKDGRIQGIGFCFHEHIDDKLDFVYDKWLKYFCGTLYLEDNADKGYLAKELAKKGVKVETYHESMNKHVKIENYLYPKWNNIDWDIDTDPEYISQILDYQQGEEPDDCCDSAASLIRQKFDKLHVDMSRWAW